MSGQAEENSTPDGVSPQQSSGDYKPQPSEADELLLIEHSYALWGYVGWLSSLMQICHGRLRWIDSAADVVDVYFHARRLARQTRDTRRILQTFLILGGLVAILILPTIYFLHLRETYDVNMADVWWMGLFAFGAFGLVFCGFEAVQRHFAIRDQIPGAMALLGIARCVECGSKFGRSNRGVRPNCMVCGSPIPSVQREWLRSGAVKPRPKRLPDTASSASWDKTFNRMQFRLYPELRQFPNPQDAFRALIQAGLQCQHSRRIPLVFAGLLVVYVSVIGAFYSFAGQSIVAWIRQLSFIAPPLFGGFCVGAIVGIGFMVGFMVPIVVAYRRPIRRALREDLLQRGIPLCMKCGYDLRAQTVARCPECGCEFDEKLLSVEPDAMPSTRPHKLS